MNPMNSGNKLVKIRYQYYAFGILLISISINLLRMTHWGRPSGEPGFDDISYLVAGGNRFRLTEEFGLIRGILSYWYSPAHSPILELLAHFSISISGFTNSIIYIIYALIMHLTLILIYKLIFRNQIIVMYASAFSIASPFGDFISNNFRPDVAWTFWTVISILYLNNLSINNYKRRLILSSVSIMIAAYFKPSYIFLHFLIILIILGWLLFFSLQIKFLFELFRNRLKVVLRLWIFPLLIFGFLYWTKNTVEAIQYNFRLRREGVFTKPIGIETVELMINSIVNLIRIEFGAWLSSIFFLTIITALYSIYFLIKNRSTVRIDFNFLIFFSSIPFTTTFVLFLGGHGGAFFAFHIVFQWLIFGIVLISVTPQPKEILNQLFGKFYIGRTGSNLVAAILLFIILCQSMIPAKSWSRSPDQLRQTKPNKELAVSLLKWCEKLTYSCDSLNIIAVGAADVNSHNVNWELMRLGSYNIVVQPVSILSTASELRKSINNFDAILFVSDVARANDDLPYNKARFDLIPEIKSGNTMFKFLHQPISVSNWGLIAVNTRLK
jgi:hypothetical protein